MRLRDPIPLLLGLLFALLVIPLAPAIATEDEAEKPVKPTGVLINPEPETELSIKVWLDKEAYQLGERLRVHFIISRDCYVYIYNISSEGKVTLLFPNAYRQANFLKAGRYTIPSKDDRYSLVTGGKPGREYIQVLATLKPLTVLVVPSSAYKENPFPLISTAPGELEKELGTQIRETLQPREWAADWVGFYLLERGQARLVINSQPPGARVYLNGHLVGETPLEVGLEPGFVQIRLEKAGYLGWAERIHVEQGEVEQIEAYLQPRGQGISPTPAPAPSPSPTPAPTPTPAPSPTPKEPGETEVVVELVIPVELIFDLGLDFNSLGMGLGFRNLLRLMLGARFTGEPVPDFYEVEPPSRPWPAEAIYRDGPEFYGDVKGLIALNPGFALVAGLGVALQEEVHIALPEGTEAQPQDVIVKPNGYRVSRYYLTALGGLLLRSGDLSLEVDYHSRRGWTLGLGFPF